MPKIALIGYGKMGQILDKLASEAGHEVVARVDPKNGYDDFDCPGLSHADVCIEFTRPDQVFDNVRRLTLLGKNIVIGTTGWDLAPVEELVRQQGVAAIHAANFSIGIHLFKKIVEAAAQLIQDQPQYDASLCEAHHRHKLDRPSGTAKDLIQSLLDNLPRKRLEDLDVSCRRYGEVPGTHTVTFDSKCDSISLTHEARSREGFALGALQAAHWIRGRQGFFTLEDMLELESLCPIK